MKKITMLLLALVFTLSAAAQEGTYNGVIKATVGGLYGPYSPADNVDIIITKNADNTINVVLPAFSLNVNVMGKISIGSYTVSNIAYDEAKGAYYRDYTGDGLSLDFSMSSSKGNYGITSLGNITLKFNGKSVDITNNLKPGKMPFSVEETFTGTNVTDDIQDVNTNLSHQSATYSISGALLDSGWKGIVIRNGKKYIQR